MKITRPELLLCALFGGVLGSFSQAFWSLEPQTASLIRLSIWVLSALWLLRAVRPAVRRPRTLLWMLWMGVGAVFSLLSTIALGFMHVYGYLTLLVISPSVTAVAAVGELCGLLASGWWWWRRPSARPVALAVGATLIFLGSIQFVFLTAWMWQPPSPGVCDGVLRPGAVERLSPADWSETPSHPYQLLYMPEESRLVATFKMGGNGVLAFWDEPTANRVWGVDLAEGGAAGVLPLHGDRLPQYMTYRPGAQELLVSRMGPGIFSLDAVSLADFPTMSLARTREVDFVSHEVVTHPDGGAYGVLGQLGEYKTLSAGALEETLGLSLDRSGDHAPVTLSAVRAPGAARVYVNLLLYPLAEVDMESGQVRWSEETFGGGVLATHPVGDRLLQTDMLFNRVDVITTDPLRVESTLTLDYTPRAIVADAERDLLMVGEWFEGVVRFYRLSTMAPIDLAVPVGPYLRDLAFDARRGRLYTATKCGVYQVEVDGLLSEMEP